MEEKKHYKTIWISDIHMGCKYSKTDLLLKFLKETECDTLFLVGDIIDGWALKTKWHWKDEYNLIIQKLLRKSRKGTKIIYIMGNHDNFLRKFDNILNFGNIQILESYVHTTSNGKKYLVIHGDQFDGVWDFMSHIGSWLYNIVLFINYNYNKIRSTFGMENYSLAQIIKTKFKSAINTMNNFENLLSQEAKTKNLVGIICGHIHHACHKMIGGIEYWNCGSWLENKCTAIVENDDGNLELIYIQ